MAEPHVITALVDKYRELAGRIKALDDDKAKLKEDLAVVDAAIRLFKKDFPTDDIGYRRVYTRSHPDIPRGTYTLEALNILREATEPMGVRDLVKEVFRRQGIEDPELASVERLRRGMDLSLMKRVKSGSVMVDRSKHPKVYWVEK